MEMKVNLHYIVTRASKHREFQIGDKVRLCEDGSIENSNAKGWMPAEDVAEATKGWAIAVDQEHRDAKRAALMKQLEELE